MSAKPLPQALPIRAAMDQSAPLASLARRLKESNARFECVQERLPSGLRTQVRPGPVDEQGWSLLAANAASAAKLRHLLPLLQQALAQAGWPAVAIRVKVHAAGR
jgi:hypothetical protein